MSSARRPILVFQTGDSDGPGSFASFLDEAGIAWRVVRVDRGDAIPTSARDVRGIGVMGGAMSVNDPLPWIPPLLALIADAMARDRPVIGHCLGGQLMARALGAPVTRNPVPEIGWGEIRVTDTPAAGDWFGPVRSFPGFHWHNETFALPDGARCIARSAWCENQVFVVGDRHLAMQCHIEMTHAGIRRWCAEGASEIATSRASPGVQDAAAIEAHAPIALPELQAVARRLYRRWVSVL